MIGWKEIKFGEIATFRNGLNFNHQSHGSGCKIIGIPDFGDRRIPDYDTLGEIIPYGIVKEDDYLNKGDIVFVRSNGNKNLVGRSLYINQVKEKLVYSGFCIRARTISENAFPLFYAYFFRTSLFRQLIAGAAGGANIQNLNQGILSRAIVPFPPVPLQKRIASILSAYDDLIENNLKHIKLLEELAQRTYEEWFVKFRVKGEQLKVDSETGLPVSWKVEELGWILVKLESGSRPKGGIDKDLKDGMPSIGAESVIGLGQYNYGKEKLVPFSFFNKMRKGIIEQKDILIYKDGAYIGKTSMFQDKFPYADCAVNEHVFLINGGNLKLQNYLFFTLNRREYFLKMQSLNSNAAQPGINQEKLKTLTLVMPSSNYIDSFDNYIEPLVKLIFNLAKQNRLLKESRDILLPRLMSGKFEVEDLEEEKLSIAAESETLYKSR